MSTVFSALVSNFNYCLLSLNALTYPYFADLFHFFTCCCNIFHCADVQHGDNIGHNNRWQVEELAKEETQNTDLAPKNIARPLICRLIHVEIRTNTNEVRIKHFITTTMHFFFCLLKEMKIFMVYLISLYKFISSGTKCFRNAFYQS